MKSNFLIKIANASIGLNGLTPTNGLAHSVVQNVNYDSSIENNINFIENTLTKYTYNNETLLDKIEKGNLSLAQKSSLIIDSFFVDNNIAENNQKTNDIKNLSEKISDDKISPEEYLSLINKNNKGITIDEVKTAFLKIRNSKKEDEKYKKEQSQTNSNVLISNTPTKPSGVVSSFEKSEKRNIGISLNNSKSKKDLLAFSESNKIEKSSTEIFKNYIKANITIADSFVWNTKQELNSYSFYANKVAIFASISTALNVAAYALAIWYTASAFWTFGASLIYAAAAWVQAGVATYFVYEAWESYKSLKQDVERLKKYTTSPFFIELERDLKELKSITNYNDSNIIKGKLINFFSNKKITLDNGVEKTLSSVITKDLKDQGVEIALEVLSWYTQSYIEKRLAHRATNYIAKIIYNKLPMRTREILDVLKNKINNFIKKLNFLYEKLINVFKRNFAKFAAKMSSKKIIIAATSWVSPITRILEAIDHFSLFADLLISGIYKLVYDYNSNIYYKEFIKNIK